jgi:hypothetical protein
LGGIQPTERRLQITGRYYQWSGRYLRLTASLAESWALHQWSGLYLQLIKAVGRKAEHHFQWSGSYS